MPISVVITRPCSACEGKGRIPGGMRQYGELVRCAPCYGSGRVNSTTNLPDFVETMVACRECGGVFVDVDAWKEHLCQGRQAK